jgi:NADPH-dependent 2,4-dienoyl-CoA reductase/sulfur reductase-like enzyme
MNAMVDVTVIGLGPAGMSVASACAEAGLTVAAVDEQPAPGGQIYRAIERNVGSAAYLGEDYAAGLDLVRRFRAAPLTYLPEAAVWHIEPGFCTSYTRKRESSTIVSKAVVVATGAHERPFPVKGWTLPGVVTVGALQILLKAHRVVSPDAVLVGNGPLLLLLAVQLASAGTPPKAIVETLRPGNKVAALPLLPAALRSWRVLRKGYGMLNAIKRAGIAFYRQAHEVAIQGEDCCRSVRFVSNGQQKQIDTSLVALHHGVIPNPQVPRLLDCAHEWDSRQHCFAPKTDNNFESSLENVFIAGDAAGIGGAAAAALRGEIVAQALIERFAGKRQLPKENARSSLRREAALRPFLDTLYAPEQTAASIQDETVVCRCEEITAGAVRRAASRGATGPSQVKAFLRAGMGPCQGRMCGNTITALIADALERHPNEVGYVRIRPPLKPLTVAELAAVENTIIESRTLLTND